MKNYSQLLILFFIITSSAFAGNPASTELRKQFIDACQKEKSAETFYTNLSNSESKDPLYQGYKGAIQVILAKYSYNPFCKYKNCKQGLSTINLAITAAPESLELRFLRLSIESNLPQFLNMAIHVHEDKSKIFALLPKSQDADLNKIIVNMLLAKKMCSSQESTQLTKPGIRTIVD